ncbi:MAG TPA: orotidine-5'-phosphate decarboxylase, partial [Bryobacteraceae bacterium]
PIIVALDFEDVEHARGLVSRLGQAVDFYKVGMELYAAAGMPFARELHLAGKQVFLDLKLYDIGETVKRTVAQVAHTDARFLTVHAINPVMRAALEGRGGASLQLMAVTVLTSFDQQDVTDMGHTCSLSELVALRARNAMEIGMDGIVCSALDAAAVRKIAGPAAIVVTPGVRSRSANRGDQKRVATPAEAIAAGANYVVIGREVTRASDPAEQVARILEDIQASLTCSAAPG